ncbi:MAG: cbb3-type cytochrome c oxidase subunit I [Verrucomicrobiota bacterium]
MSESENMNDEIQRLKIDQSVRGPVLFFFINALLWLFFGTIAGAFVALKLNNPTFLESFLGIPLPILSYGRLFPAFEHMWIYGWCFQASFGALVWLAGRLTRAELKLPAVTIAAGFFWNLAVTAGIIAIQFGQGTSYSWFEFPPAISLSLLFAITVIAFQIGDMIRRRNRAEPFISLWYIAAAIFWFPAIYLATNLMLSIRPVSGVMTAVVNSWFKQGLVGLWFVPIGLGIAYYMIPKVTGQRIHSYYLAAVGFWSLAFLAPWNAGNFLIGSPLPAWIQTAGISSTILMMIPAGLVSYNFFKTIQFAPSTAGASPTLRFVLFGAAAYMAGSAILALTSLRSISLISQFSVYSIGHFNLMFYAFFTMMAFGAMYFIMPRLVGCEWVSSRLIGWHFMATAYGVGILVFFWMVGGFLQGSAINSSSTAHLTGFENAIEALKLVIWLPVIPIVILAVGQAIFILHFLLMLLRLGRVTGGPTLLAAQHEIEAQGATAS